MGQVFEHLFRLEICPQVFPGQKKKCFFWVDIMDKPAFQYHKAS